MKVIPRMVRLKNGKQVILRSASTSDAENLLRHLRITHKESYNNLNQSADFWNNFSTNEEEKILAEFENSKIKFMLVAEFQGLIIGGLGFVGQQAEFLKKNAGIGMSIQKAFCNFGLGAEMIKYAIEQAKEFGFHRIDLTVRTFNLSGIALYEKLGFKRIGLLKDAAFIDGKFVDEFSYQIILN